MKLLYRIMAIVPLVLTGALGAIAQNERGVVESEEESQFSLLRDSTLKILEEEFIDGTEEPSLQESGSVFSVKGFVDTYHAMRSASPHDFLSSRTRVRGEAELKIDRSSLFVSLNAQYNPIIKEANGFQLREAYFDYREDHWGIRLGRQLVIWGAADGIRITDVVSPMDMTEFLAQDYDDIRMPVNALRGFLYNETFKLELLAIPFFEGFKLPIQPTNPWSLLANQSMPMPIRWQEEGSHPAFTLKNVEYGGRLSATLPGIDFSFSALHTWNKRPVINQLPGSNEILLRPEYFRMGFVGADISKPLEEFVLRGEVAYNIDKHFVREQGCNTIHWLIGADWYAPNDWILMAQISCEHLLNPPVGLTSKQDFIATLHLSKKLFSNTLQLSNFTYLDLDGMSWFSRFSVDYALSDQIHLMAGYDWFHGDKGYFGLFQKNSEGWVKAKYSF